MLFKDTNMGTRPDFTPSDRLILGSILHSDDKVNREKTLLQLKAMNDTPTVFVSWDIDDWKERWFIRPYVRFARSLVRQPTDVVMVTHLILYFSTSVPSALFLYHHFTYLHAFLHLLMQGYYIGTYTLMMHQHIHMRGILSKKYAWFDHLFPYILDPLMGHTWNSYFYHHVKHHHVEGNGPHDLSSTIRYQRDSPLHFLIYVSRFFFLIWAELPVYFYRKGQYETLAKALVSEYGCFAFIICMAKFVNFRASLFVLLLPLLFIRLGLMVGNWGQHAFVDEEDPASDFRSSITLIDVAVSPQLFHWPLYPVLCPVSSQTSPPPSANSRLTTQHDRATAIASMTGTTLRTI